MKVMKILWAFILPFSLMGCVSVSGGTTTKSEFDCKAAEGQGCTSIGEIREDIAYGRTTLASTYHGQTPGVSVSGVPEYKPDEILKIHIGDFVDSSGIYHSDSLIYVVAREGGWKVD